MDDIYSQYYRQVAALRYTLTLGVASTELIQFFESILTRKMFILGMDALIDAHERLLYPPTNVAVLSSLPMSTFWEPGLYMSCAPLQDELSMNFDTKAWYYNYIRKCPQQTNRFLEEVCEASETSTACPAGKYSSNGYFELGSTSCGSDDSCDYDSSCQYDDSCDYDEACGCDNNCCMRCCWGPGCCDCGCNDDYDVSFFTFTFSENPQNKLHLSIYINIWIV